MPSAIVELGAPGATLFTGHLFDLTKRLASDGRGELLDVRLRQMRPEQHERREMQLAPLDPLQQRRKPLHQPCGRDPPERRAFAHPEASLTEIEHRRAGGTQIEAPLLHFEQVDDDPRSQRVTLRAQLREPGHLPRPKRAQPATLRRHDAPRPAPGASHNDAQ